MILNPEHKAICVCAFFACAGIVGYIWYPGNGVPALGIFFATLTINTYFSIRFYTDLFPILSPIDWFIESALVVLYLGLAVTLSSVLLFQIIGFLLFSVAAMKYNFLLTRKVYESTLRKKILIDMLGAAFLAMCAVGTAAGFATISAWILCLLFLTANIYLLWYRPMYQVVS